MRKIRLLLFGVALSVTGVFKAQIAGTFSVPATYTSIAAAINDLNTQGVNGPVTILVDAGYTETAPLGGFTFTATGTSANTITFQKNGTGANPLISAYTGGTATPTSAQQDGVWKFVGSDYVTIDGIDIVDPNTSNPSTMEYGFGFFKASATNGCQFNTIKNCNISLKALNNAAGTLPATEGSRGIDVVNSLFTSHTTNITVSSAAGSNSNNKFYSNTISNCNIGIALIGYVAPSPYTNADTGNDVGGSVVTDGNMITNFGGGGTNASSGIRTQAQYGLNISNNTINSNNGTGTNHAGILRGLYLLNATAANVTVTNNTITVKGGGTTQALYGMDNSSGSTGTTNTVTIANNLITNCTYTTATSGVFYGIYNSASPSVLSISSNTFTGNSTNATSGSYYNVYNIGGALSINITSNLISGITFSATSTSLANYNIYNGGSLTTSTININSNNIENITYSGSTGGTGVWAGIYSVATGTVHNMQNNTLSNLNLKTTGTMYMFYNSHYSATTSINSNSVVGVFSRLAAGTGALYGIYNGYFSTLGTVANIYDNNLSNISNGGNTGSVYMLYWTTHNTANIYNNTFSNILAGSGTGVFYGLYPYYYSATTNIYDNTVSDVTYGTGTIYGMYFYEYNGTSANVYNNTFYNLKNGGNTNIGLYIYYTGSTGSGMFNFHRNRISDIGSSGATASGVAGINLYSANGGTVNLYNNLVANITATASSNNNAVSGINVSSPSAALIANLYYNSVYLSGTSSALGFGSSALYANTNPSLLLRNNIFVNNTNATGSGLAVAYRRNGTNLSTYSTLSNNNLFYAGTPSASNAIFYDFSTPYNTLATFQAFVTPRENVSVTENPPFVSTAGNNSNFLNISTVTPTQIEGWAIPVAGISSDYTLTLRNASTPDIGAWEGNYTSSIPPCTGAPAANTVVASSATICPNTPVNLSLATSYTNTGYTYQWQASTTSSVSGFANISGATAAAYSSTISGTTWFQVIISCGSNSIITSPVEVQIGGNPCTCLAYCNSAATSTADDEILNVAFGSLNNTSTCSQTGGPGSILNRYSNYSGVVPAPPIAAGATYPLAVTVGQCGSFAYSGYVTAFIDYNQNGSFADPGELVYTSPNTQFQVAGTTLTTNISIPVGASVGITRLRIVAVESSSMTSCAAYTYGETEDYCIDILAPVPCSGAPGTNTAVATLTSVCPNGSVALSLANTYTTTGITYQWSAATSSVGPFTAVSGGTLSSLTVTNMTATTWYQAVITCTNGPASFTTAPIEIVVSSNPCQCASYCASAAGIATDDEIFNVSIGTLNNTSTCSQTGGPGSILNRYSNYTGIVAAPSLTAGVPYTMSVTVGECGSFSYSGGVVVYMDFNQNGLFTDAGELVYSSPNTAFAVAGTMLNPTVNIPASATSGITRMRVIAVRTTLNLAPCATYNYGETEDYCINIAPAVPCSGAPASNTAVATSSAVCASSTVGLSLATTYTTGGLTYQWSASTSSTGPWTPVASGTTAAFTVSGFSATTWYQAVITCTNGPASTSSTPVEVLLNTNPCNCLAYCTSSATSVNDEEIFNVTIGTLSNSSTCGQTGGPGSVQNQYSNYTGIVAAPNFVGGNNYNFSVTVGQCNTGSYSGGVTIYMDFNQNGLFTDAGEQVYASPSTLFQIAGTLLTGNISIPPTASPGITRMRVIAVEGGLGQAPCTNYSWGETEDYCINIVPPTPCAGAPSANTVVATSSVVCPGGNTTLNLANTYTLGGLTYQWSTSTSSLGPWTPVSTATLSSFTATNITVTTWYQAVITCTNGPASTTAVAAEVNAGGNPCLCAAYCASSATSVGDDEIFNVSIGTLNNTSNCSQTGGPGSSLNRYSNYAGMLAAPSLTINQTYTLGVTVGQCGSGAYSGIVTAFIDYNQNGAFTDAGELVYTSTYTTFAVAGTTFTTNVTIPVTAVGGTTRMRVIAVESSVPGTSCGAYTWGETEDYCVYIDPGPPCTTANSGTIATPSYSACNNQTVSLTSTSVSIGQGTSYQWLVSTTPGGPYTAVAGGSGSNTPSYITPVLTATNVYYYVLETTCANTSVTAVSNEATVAVNGYPSASVAPVSTICAGQNLVLGSSTDFGNTFSWFGPNSYTSSVQNPTITNAPAAAQGTYTLVVSAQGCSATPVYVTTTVNSTNLVIQSNPGSLCLGNTATLTAVGNPTTLTWNNGATTNSITVTPTTSTVYSVVGTGTSNCTANESYTLTVYNPTISTTDATVCTTPGTSTLTATGFTTSVVNWYSSPTSTVSIATGTAYTPPLASSTTTYYAQAANSSTNSLFVSLAAGNGQQGNMFDIVAQQNIEINGFDMHLSNTTTNTVEIWYRPGTFVGFTNSNAGWTQVLTTTVTGLGNGSLTPVPLTFTVPMLSGQTYGWYVTCNGGGNVNYTNGTTVGALWASNSDLQVLQGNGGTYFGVTFTPRCFNGQVYYSKPGCTSPMMAAVLNVGTPLNITASAANGTVCAGGSTALNASGATTYTWDNGATGSIIAVTPTVNTTYTVTGSNSQGCQGTATVAVAVNALPSVSLTAAQTTVCTNGPTVGLSGSPAGGAYTGSFVTTGVFTPPATAGTYMPSYNVTSTVTGCSNSASVTIVVSPCTGTENTAARINGLSVYPNPTLGELTIELSNGLAKSVEVSDLTGRIIYSGTSAKDIMNVNINSFANGVYFVKVKSNDTVEIIKVVKQ